MTDTVSIQQYTLYKNEDITPDIYASLQTTYDLSHERPRQSLDNIWAIAKGIFAHDQVPVQYLSQQEAEALIKTEKWQSKRTVHEILNITTG